MARILPFQRHTKSGEKPFWQLVHANIRPFLEDECERMGTLGKAPQLCAEERDGIDHITLLFRAIRAEQRLYIAITARDKAACRAVSVEVKVLTADMTSIHTGIIATTHYRNASRAWFEESYFDAIDILSAHPARSRSYGQST